jgi:tetratricopeptide (TPR) repeat protein
MKSKIVAGILALFFGIFGVHRFYLGKWIQGVAHLLLFLITLVFTIEEHWPAVIAPALLGFIDAVLFFAIPVEDFDEKYNARRLQERMREKRYYKLEYEEEEESWQTQSDRKTFPLSLLKKIGIERFRAGDFDGAVNAFVKALEKGVEHPWLHFNLACCYSMIQDADAAMEHLEKAIEKGFTDLRKIQTHAALQYLREQPEFTAFVARGYKKAPIVPSPAELPSASSVPLNPLDQLLQLGELKSKGLLSEEEFQREKQKILR